MSGSLFWLKKNTSQKGEQLSQIWAPDEWLVLAFFKIEFWNFQNKLSSWGGLNGAIKCNVFNWEDFAKCTKLGKMKVPLCILFVSWVRDMKLWLLCSFILYSKLLTLLKIDLLIFTKSLKQGCSQNFTILTLKTKIWWIMVPSFYLITPLLHFKWSS